MSDGEMFLKVVFGIMVGIYMLLDTAEARKLEKSGNHYEGLVLRNMMMLLAITMSALIRLWLR